MQKINNFETYLEKNYYNDIFEAIKIYMKEHKNSLGVHSYVVLDMSYIELDDIHVKSVCFHQGEGNLLNFSYQEKQVPIMELVWMEGLGCM